MSKQRWERQHLSYTVRFFFRSLGTMIKGRIEKDASIALPQCENNSSQSNLPSRIAFTKIYTYKPMHACTVCLKENNCNHNYL